MKGKATSHAPIPPAHASMPRGAQNRDIPQIEIRIPRLDRTRGGKLGQRQVTRFFVAANCSPSCQDCKNCNTKSDYDVSLHAYTLLKRSGQTIWPRDVKSFKFIIVFDRVNVNAECHNAICRGDIAVLPSGGLLHQFLFSRPCVIR